MRRKYYFVLFLLFASSCCLGDISKKDIDSSIDKKDLIHPYLLFSQNDKEIVIKRINENSECRDIWKRLAAEANRLIHQHVDHNIHVQGKNPRAEWTE